MLKNSSQNKLLSTAIVSVLYLGLTSMVSATTVVTQWNDAALQAIRTTRPGPTVVSRALAITNTCMFDAFAAYDAKAKGTQLGVNLRRTEAEFTDSNKHKAISFAAYTCLKNLFPSQTESFNALMATLGYSINEPNTTPYTPASVGVAAANAVIVFRSVDNSNQSNSYVDTSNYTPINTPTTVNDPNHWQPLQIGATTQSFVTPHWSMVTPYALTTGSQYRSILKAPADYVTEPQRYKVQAQQVVDYTANLTDEKKVIAEYWADGPSSELPPGHFVLFAKDISTRDRHTIDQDVKMFFALTNAVFDAGIVAWDAKRAFDYVRPVTAVHVAFAGQNIPSWQGIIAAADWKPYQPSNVVTPSFPEYISGHSIFSAAAAETLKLFTKSDYFGSSVKILAGSSKVETGKVPAADTTLYWATFSDAADEAGISRRYGGIHFVDGDLESRKLGRLVGQQAWFKSLSYFNDPAFSGNYYDPNTKILTLEDVDVKGKHYSMTLTNKGNFQFTLTSTVAFESQAAASTVQYDAIKGIVSIPKLLFEGKLYSATLLSVAESMFSLGTVTPL